MAEMVVDAGSFAVRLMETPKPMLAGVVGNSRG
jgi:hypothetical protein